MNTNPWLRDADTGASPGLILWLDLDIPPTPSQPGPWGRRPRNMNTELVFQEPWGEGSWGSQITNFCGWIVIVKKHEGASSFGHSSKATATFLTWTQMSYLKSDVRRWVHTALTAPWPGWWFLGSLCPSCFGSSSAGPGCASVLPQSGFCTFFDGLLQNMGHCWWGFLAGHLESAGDHSSELVMITLSVPRVRQVRHHKGFYLALSHPATQPQASWEWWCLQLAGLLCVNRKEIPTVEHGPSLFHFCPISGSHVHTRLEFCCFSSTRCPPPWPGREHAFHVTGSI